MGGRSVYSATPVRPIIYCPRSAQRANHDEPPLGSSGQRAIQDVLLCKVANTNNLEAYLQKRQDVWKHHEISTNEIWPSQEPDLIVTILRCPQNSGWPYLHCLIGRVTKEQGWPYQAIQPISFGGSFSGYPI